VTSCTISWSNSQRIRWALHTVCLPSVPIFANTLGDLEATIRLNQSICYLPDGNVAVGWCFFEIVSISGFSLFHNDRITAMAGIACYGRWDQQRYCHTEAGISLFIVHWSTSFLCERWLRVKISRILSNSTTLRGGMPQGPDILSSLWTTQVSLRLRTH